VGLREPIVSELREDGVDIEVEVFSELTTFDVRAPIGRKPGCSFFSIDGVLLFEQVIACMNRIRAWRGFCTGDGGGIGSCALVGPAMQYFIDGR